MCFDWDKIKDNVKIYNKNVYTLYENIKKSLKISNNPTQEAYSAIKNIL